MIDPIVPTIFASRHSATPIYFISNWNRFVFMLGFAEDNPVITVKEREATFKTAFGPDHGRFFAGSKGFLEVTLTRVNLFSVRMFIASQLHDRSYYQYSVGRSDMRRPFYNVFFNNGFSGASISTPFTTFIVGRHVLHNCKVEEFSVIGSGIVPYRIRIVASASPVFELGTFSHTLVQDVYQMNPMFPIFNIIDPLLI